MCSWRGMPPFFTLISMCATRRSSSETIRSRIREECNHAGAPPRSAHVHALSVVLLARPYPSRSRAVTTKSNATPALCSNGSRGAAPRVRHPSRATRPKRPPNTPVCLSQSCRTGRSNSCKARPLDAAVRHRPERRAEGLQVLPSVRHRPRQSRRSGRRGERAIDLEEQEASPTASMHSPARTAPRGEIPPTRALCRTSG